MKNKLKVFIISIIIFSSSMVCYAFSAGYLKASIPVIADARAHVDLPILMYHGITNDPSKVGDYSILASTFESDLVWLKDKGYTTISATQLINYVEKGSALPAKPVLLTFDDGYENNYTLAFPLLKKYNMKAIISVIGSESNIYPEVASSNLIEFGNHTYDLHSNDSGRKGADKLKGESQEEYSKVLSEDLLKNQEFLKERIGYYPVVFAWPYGAYPMDGSANDVLKKLGFKMSLTSYQIKNNIEQGNPDTLFGLKRFLRTTDFDINKII